MTDPVIFSELPAGNNKKIAVATLNAEKSLNALNHIMIDCLYETLQTWQSDDAVVCVFIKSSSEKAFCAGGDVRLLSEAVGSGDQQAPVVFFEKEYRLDYLIHMYEKPVICWGNGIVMGGGLGLMAGAAFRVVTDTTVMAMPEISIGLYPDVAGSWMLNRMPSGIGLFMALTGCRLNSADAMYLRLANRFIDHAFLDNVLKALQEANWQGNAHHIVYDIMSHYSDKSAGLLPYSKVREHRDLIGQLMSHPTPQRVMENLQSLETSDEWLIQSRDTALRGSPLSATISFWQLRKARHLSLKEVFCSELTLSVNTALKGDFCEGVRALLVEKDNKPVWKYSSVADVDDAFLDSLFVAPWEEHPLADL